MAKGTVNKVTILGRLGADPEIRYMQNGTAVANLRIATNDGYKDKNTGQYVDQTEWHKVSMFGKPAEVIAQYSKKGQNIYIEGRIKTTKYQDKATGADRYSTEIIANEFQFIGGQSDKKEQSVMDIPDNNPNHFAKEKQTENRSLNTNNSGIPSFSDDDIPF